MRREDQITEARKLLGYIEKRTTALADGVYRNPVETYTCRTGGARAGAVLPLDADQYRPQLPAAEPRRNG